MRTFCNECGNAIVDNAGFCDNCGTKVINDYDKIGIEGLKLRGRKYLSLLKKEFLKILGVLGVLGMVLVAYFLYEHTQETILQTSRQLQQTEEKLNDIATSTAQKLTDQEKELNQKSNQIAKLEADLKSVSSSSATSSNVAGNALASLSPSVVKIVCYSDAYGDDLQMGSGVLYHSDYGTPSTYFVETNLHVVKTSDGSSSKCAIAVYPNYRNPSDYLVYETAGYKIYKYGVDFAYLIPQITNSEKAGKISDLIKYAKDFTSNTYCKSTSIGDHISILGYPGVGGSSLTATDGIISGFEYESGVRFIKTSAKIEHGNSGGVAIKDSGCILGIPTFVETGSAESIGRILDLNDLFNN